MKTKSLAIVLCSLFALQVSAGDFKEDKMKNWHQWRGPTANGVALNANPPLKWDEKTNIKWKVAIPGESSATPIVWGDKVFVISAVKTEKKGKVAANAKAKPQTKNRQFTEAQREEFRKRFAKRQKQNKQAGGNQKTGKTQRKGRFGGGQRRGGRRGGFGFGSRTPTNIHKFNIICLDRKTGKVVWQKTANEVLPHEGKHGTGSFAPCSPVTDGKNLYVSFGSRGIYCYDLDGNLKWKRDLGKMSIARSFGEGTSPAVHNGTLIVNWDHEDDSYIYALDTSTGKDKWKIARDERTTWATPLIVEHKGKTHVITSASKRIRSYDLETGKVNWECGGNTRNVIPSPVYSNGVVYCFSGFFGASGLAIPIDSEGDITDSDKIVWKVNRGTPYVPSPMLYEGQIYFFQGNRGTLSTVDAKTGKQVYGQKRIPDMRQVYASPVGAGGHVFLSGRDGATHVIKHGKNYEFVGTNKLDGELDASPAIVGNQIFLRSKTHVYCIAEGSDTE